MSVAAQDNNKERSVAFAITIILHAGIVLLLWLMVVGLPDPPLEGSGSGMVVNLGYVDESTGDIQPLNDNQTEPIVTQKEMQQTAAAQEKIITQSIEESEKIATTDKPVTDKVQDVKPNETTNATETQVEQPRTVDPTTLYTGKKNNATSQGNYNKGTGDQGDPNGDPNATVYGKNTGTGTTPGSGGDGPGGNGPGNGRPSYDMKGRKAQSLPTPQFNIQEEGKVVVEIIIDRQGNVLRATPGVRGSTTTSVYLLNKAKESALKAKFSSNPDAPEEQRGTIVYTFLLK